MDHWPQQDRPFLLGPNLTWTEIERLRELRHIVSDSRRRLETMLWEARPTQTRIEREFIFLSLERQLAEKLEHDLFLI